MLAAVRFPLPPSAPPLTTSRSRISSSPSSHASNLSTMLAVDFNSRPVFQPLPMPRSPLGARDANTCPWSFPIIPMSSNEKTLKTRPIEPRKRESKFAPLLRKKDDRDLRRNAYMNKGKVAREDQRFEARAEQSLRLEWIAEQRQWQAQKEADDASRIEVDPDLDTPDSPMQEPSHPLDMPEDEEMPMSEEDEAFQYYISSQQQRNQDAGLPDLTQFQQSQPVYTQQMEFWSDDDEFEQSLLEAAMQIERAPDHNQPNAPGAEQEDMDIAMG